jgi:hypothetical protein
LAGASPSQNEIPVKFLGARGGATTPLELLEEDPELDELELLEEELDELLLDDGSW